MGYSIYLPRQLGIESAGFYLLPVQTYQQINRYSQTNTRDIQSTMADKSNMKTPNMNGLEESNFDDYSEYFRQKQKQEREERQNIHRIKTPIEKLQSIPPNRLDEGLCDSLCDEFGSMCTKFSYVLLPRSDQNSYKLRNWDLWGPFFMCLIYGIFINNSEQFLFIFFSVFVGATIVTFNIRVLGGDISFFQSVAILGYCLFPIFMAIFILKLLRFFQIRQNLVQIILMFAAMIWSIISSRAFVGINVPESKKYVAIYPIILYYFYMAVILAL